MTAGIFDNASMVSTVLRVLDITASVRWYREKLGLEPVHVGADGDHPIAVYRIAGSVVSLWQLPVGQARVRDDNDPADTNVVIVLDGDLVAPAAGAVGSRSRCRRVSAAAPTTSSCGSTIPTATGSS